MNNYDLSEYSKSYHQESEIYQVFSNAEDYPNLITKQLIPRINCASLLDMGCGNGKYVSLLEPYTTTTIAIDKSYEQLFLAQHNNLNSKAIFIQADARHIPLKDNSVQHVLACWMLGTILNDQEKLVALNEMKRVCSHSIILVENLVGSEFEVLRGRFPDSYYRTANYNNFLLDNGFFLTSEISTYFQFSSVEQANFIFRSIWHERLVKKIDKAQISHEVGIFVYTKK